MGNTKTIAGLSMTVKFCNKVNEKTPINSVFVPSEPLVSIYQGQNEGDYIVNIMTYAPAGSLEPLKTKDMESGLFLNKEQTLFLKYGGVCNAETSVDNMDEGILICRDFEFVYDSEVAVPTEFDLYHIQFTYKLMADNFQSVEGILVRDVNLDPVSSRGTITTVHTHR